MKPHIVRAYAEAKEFTHPGHRAARIAPVATGPVAVSEEVAETTVNAAMICVPSNVTEGNPCRFRSDAPKRPVGAA